MPPDRPHDRPQPMITPRCRGHVAGTHRHQLIAAAAAVVWLAAFIQTVFDSIRKNCRF